MQPVPCFLVWRSRGYGRAVVKGHLFLESKGTKATLRGSKEQVPPERALLIYSLICFDIAIGCLFVYF